MGDAAEQRDDQDTVLDRLVASLLACGAAVGEEVDPACVLWCDEPAAFAPLRSVLQDRLAAAGRPLLTLGEYDPAAATGPAIWLRYVLDGPRAGEGEGGGGNDGGEFRLDPDAIPVIHLPGVGQDDLDPNASGDDIAPLIELRYRGAVWEQRNGKDWTPTAFLSAKPSHGGLGLEVSRDGATRAAVGDALPEVFGCRVADLRAGRLDAAAVGRLAVPDPTRVLLDWLADPAGFRSSKSAAAWATACGALAEEFGLDPRDDDDRDPVEHAARLLRDGGARSGAAGTAVGKSGAWDRAWDRFRDAPDRSPGVADRLRDVPPQSGTLALGLTPHPDRDPVHNARRERELRDALTTAAGDGVPHHDLCDRLVKLEDDHGDRRGWVWADLGDSPLTVALEPLSDLAAAAASSPVGATLEAAAAAHASGENPGGWRADAAAVNALALAADLPADAAGLVRTLVARLDGPRLWAGAEHLQRLAGDGFRDLAAAADADDPAAPAGTCVVFADGLRFDVAAGLRDELINRFEKNGDADAAVTLSHRLAPLPTVTATAKPYASPARDAFAADGGTPAKFEPALKPGEPHAGKPYTADRLRAALKTRGFVVLTGDEAACPGPEAVGWTEAGTLDKKGHDLGAELAREVSREVAGLADRVTSLLAGGWRRVRVVTDHGWLLLPGGLPRVDLPKFLTDSRWARCGVVKDDAADPGVPEFVWHWSAVGGGDGGVAPVRVGTPPGCGAFAAAEYAHGGVSPQECVLPVLEVSAGGPAASAKITALAWRGLRCRLTVSAEGADVGELRAALRRNATRDDGDLPGPDPVKPGKGTGGTVGLLVADDALAGTAVTAVVLASDGTVLARRPTEVPTL